MASIEQLEAENQEAQFYLSALVAQESCRNYLGPMPVTPKYGGYGKKAQLAYEKVVKTKAALDAARSIAQTEVTPTEGDRKTK